MSDGLTNFIKQVEWFSAHWYKIEFQDGDARWIPSVTTKLNIVDKPFLRRWVGDIGTREANLRLFEAQERGSRIHNAFDIFQRGGLIIYQPWQRPNYTKEELDDLKAKNPLCVVVSYQDEMFDCLKLSEFFAKVDPEILLTESTVYSLEDNDAGTVDAVYRIKEGKYEVSGSRPLYLPAGVYVADLKTGREVDKSAYRQTAAYRNCLLKMGIYKPDEVVGTLILHTQSKNKGGIAGFSVHVRTGLDLKNDFQEYRLASDLWMADHADDAPKVFQFPSLLRKKLPF